MKEEPMNTKRRRCPKRIDPQEWMRCTGACIDEMRRLIKGLVKTGDTIMGNLQEVQADLDTLNTNIAAERAEVQANAATAKAAHEEAMAEIQRLTDLIAQGGAVSSADFDGLRQKIAEAQSGVQAISDAVPADPTQPKRQRR